MIFNTYNNSFDRGYDLSIPNDREPVLNFSPMPDTEIDEKAKEEGPIVSIKELGASIPEGNRFGTFIQGLQSAIRLGVGTVELASSQGGGHEPVGVENYGKEARQELRELAKINDVDIKSIHSPSNIGNLSGYNPQERGFSDEFRKQELDEVKKAIDFAADVAGQGAVVVHTGEFPRDMSDAWWNKKDEYGNPMFKSYEEEENRNVKYLVDDRTGKLITEVRKSQIVRMPKFLKMKNPKHGNRLEYVAKAENGDYDIIDEKGDKWRFLNETDPNDLFKRVAIQDLKNVQFKTERYDWKHYEKLAEEWNKYFKKQDGRKWTPEEVFFRDQMNLKVSSARGSSLFYGRSYPKVLETEEKVRKALEFFKKVEKSMDPKRRWELLKKTTQDFSHYASDALHLGLVNPDEKMPSEILQKVLDDIELEKRYIHEASASADASADEALETVEHVVPVEVYAKQQTAKSYAEAGIHAMMQSLHNKNAKGDIFVAPENIFPEMGYGSHPEELIDLVKNARKKMAEYLTKDWIEDPSAHRLNEHEVEEWNKKHPDMKRNKGDLALVPNPYKMNISEAEAMKRAEKHIKATFDTQHIGMWWKNFTPKPGETIEERKKRFDKWYMDEVKKLEESGIIGHMHVVDSGGSGHHHLPAGQGVFPVVEAVKYLKKKGYSGSMISEGYGENNYSPGRILTETWRAFGNNIVRDAGLFTTQPNALPQPSIWNYTRQSYYGQTQPPYFIFGNYAPSNEWSLWSQVPME